MRNHARALLACDFMVAVTARFQCLYIFVVMEIGSRRILHCNVTLYPTAQWTIQQLREAIPSDHEYRFLIHDRHATFSSGTGRSRCCPWTAGVEDAHSSTAGKCVLRATDRNDEKGMLGLYDSAQRSPSPQDSSRMGFTLQPRPPALPLGTRNSGSEVGTSAQGASPPH